MGQRINLDGMKFGCLTVLGKAASRIAPSGGVKGYWHVRCDCGREKEMQPKALMTRKHVACGKECPFSWGAATSVVCGDCGFAYTIQYRGKKSLAGNLCHKCVTKRATAAVVGKPSSNRLQDGEAAFNSLFGAYRRNAVGQRGVPFEITKDEFRALTKCNCTYCGLHPSSIREGDALRSKGKSSGSYIYNGVDRIDSSLGYVKGNVVTCCAECNRMKGAMEVTKFLSHIARIYKHHKSQ